MAGNLSDDIDVLFGFIDDLGDLSGLPMAYLNNLYKFLIQNQPAYDQIRIDILHDLQDLYDQVQTIAGGALTYVAEDVANKATDFSVLNNTLYPTTQAVDTYINSFGFVTSYTETDPVVRAINGIVKSNGTIISAAVVGTDYVTASSTNTFTNKSGNISQWTNDSGYLTSFSEVDPVFTAWLAGPPDLSEFNNDVGYITTYVETDPVFSASDAAGITATDISHWNTAFGWGNHAVAGYEFQSNKATSFVTLNNTLYPTTQAVANYVSSFGYGTGTVTSVSGTANRITSTGGATPVIDISATFEALLGKVTSPLSQFAATTSLQLKGVISDETGSGALVFGTTPTLSSPTIDKIANLTSNGFVITSGGDGTLSIDTSTYLTTSSAAATYQPLDSDLTTIAGLTATTDNFIVSVSSAWASRTPAQVRTTLGLVIGTNVQAWDADLDGIAALSGSSGFLKTNGSGTWSVDTNTYLTTSSASATYQPLDADLTTIAGLTATTDNFIVSVSSAWASRTPAQVKTTLSLNNVENTALSTWAGSTNITTLGTIATGVWNGTAIANANLANSTISGVALGGTLAALTATDTTLTFSGSYTGNTARTVGINLANANTWTAEQTIQLATEQFKLAFDASNNVPFTVSSGGALTIAPTGNSLILAGSLQTSPTAANSNLLTGNGGNAAVTSNASYNLGGTGSIHYRSATKGATALTATASANYSSFLIGQPGTVTTAASGTHTIFSQLIIRPLSIAIGTATVTNSASLYIEDAATNATNNYAIWSDSGTNRFDGSTLFGTTISPQANDGAALGTTALMFSDLFLATGGVINWNNGNATLTHSASALAFNSVPVTVPVRATATSTSTSVTFTSAQYGTAFLWSPSGTATATLPANGATSGSWFEVYLLTDQTITISAATADTLITFNDTAADSVAFSTAGSKIGGIIRFISNGSVWIAVNLSNNTMTVAT